MYPYLRLSPTAHSLSLSLFRREKADSRHAALTFLLLIRSRYLAAELPQSLASADFTILKVRRDYLHSLPLTRALFAHTHRRTRERTHTGREGASVRPGMRNRWPIKPLHVRLSTTNECISDWLMAGKVNRCSSRELSPSLLSALSPSLSLSVSLCTLHTR